MDNSMPLISVIMLDASEHALSGEFNHSIQAQTFSRDQFEVVVVTNGNVHAKLGPMCRLVQADSKNIHEAYNAGVNEARGSLVVFLDSRCRLDPECLKSAADFMKDESYDAAELHSSNIDTTTVARFESRSRGKTGATSPDKHLRLFNCIIRRKKFMEAGGFPTDAGQFAETVLATNLHQRGCRIGYASEAKIERVNTLTLDALQEHLRQYIMAECQFISTQDPDVAEHLYSGSSILGRAGAFSDHEAEILRYAVEVTMDTAAPADKGWIEALHQPLVPHVRARLGERAVKQASRRLGMARLRYAFWFFNEERRFKAFEDLRKCTVDLARATFIRDHAKDPPAPRALDPFDQGRLRVCGLAGCHPVEEHKGQLMRWTGPTALLSYELPPSDCIIRIETGRLRGWGGECMAFFWNDQLLERKHAVWDRDSLALHIQKDWCVDGRPQTLAIVAKPLTTAESETRALGLPMFGVHFQMIEPEQLQTTEEITRRREAA